jgi:hypothetical protein
LRCIALYFFALHCFVSLCIALFCFAPLCIALPRFAQITHALCIAAYCMGCDNHEDILCVYTFRSLLGHWHGGPVAPARPAAKSKQPKEEI